MTATVPARTGAPPVDERVILSVQNLRTTFKTDAGLVKAVDGVSFDIRRGEVFAVVGESGSGKSVTAMSIMGLLATPPALIEADGVFWKGTNLLEIGEDRMRTVRGGEIGMIFQDPLTALNPVHTIGRQIAEMARIHEKVSKREARARAIEMLGLVGIPQPSSRIDMYPHEFSGGMRQRAMIAMAITCNPDLLIADEPTTALDVTVQAQVLEVLMRIKDEIDSSIMLITHDLGVVAGMADIVMVMYAGRQVEFGAAKEIFYRTRHPYTLGLMASIPRLDSDAKEKLVPIRGAPPSMIRLPSGCRFHPRCDFARERCTVEDPPLRPIAGAGHLSACHFAEELEGADLREIHDWSEP